MDRITKPDLQDEFKTLQDTYSKPNRLTGSSNYNKATDWIKSKYETNAPHVWVEYQEWTAGSARYRNVLLWLNGTDANPGYYMVGGHLDSVAGSPGMDDDGSGSLGSALIGLAAANYVFKDTIIFALWDAEESGLIGSRHWVAYAKNAALPIRYYINMDMIAYDPNNNNKFRVNTKSQYIADLHTAVVSSYNVPIGIAQGPEAGCNTDHCEFARQGYDNSADDEFTFNNANWHQPSDTIQQSGWHWDTLTNTIKVVAGVLAESATMQGKRNVTTAVKLDVTPKNQTLDLSKSLQYRAKGFDSNGTPAPLPAPVSWSTSSGTISSTGYYTPAVVGNHTITATSGNLTANTMVQVLPAVLSRIEVQPRDSVITEDQTVSFSATGYDGTGKAVDPQPVFTWNVTPKGEITVDGKFTPAGAGYYTVTARAGVFTDSTNVEVKTVTLSKLQISIDDIDCKAVGAIFECDTTTDQIDFFAEAWDDAGVNLNWNAMDDGSKVTWYLSQSGFGVIKDDWTMGPNKTKTGSLTITATAYGKDSNALNVSMVPGVISSVTLTPEGDQTLEGGSTIQFTVKANDSKGNTIQASRLSTKYSVNPADLGTIDDKGVFKAVKKGRGKVVADVTDTKYTQSRSDDTVVEVTVVDAPPPPPPPSNPTSGLLIPIIAIAALAGIAAAAFLMMRRKRKDAVKDEVKATPSTEAKATEDPAPVKAAHDESVTSTPTKK